MRRDPRLLVALAVTGLFALAAEVIWSRALIPWVGGTAWSQIATVAIYMGGLFLGSLVAVRLLPRIADPRRTFLLVEIGACVASLAAVLALPLADPLLSAFSKGPLLASGLGSVLRGLAGGGLMLPATILMGVSFPLAIAAIDRGRGARGSAALAYGVNTLGATAGALLGGFVLVPRLGVVWGVVAVAALDLVVLALSGLGPTKDVAAAPAQKARPQPAKRDAAPPPAESRARAAALIVSITIGGVVSLGLEVVLFRVLGLLLGPTARAFTVVLAVYVLGLGIGSLLVRPIVGRSRSAAEWVYFACWIVVGGVGLIVHAKTGALTDFVANSRAVPVVVEGVGLRLDLASQLAKRAWISGLVLLPLTCAFGASYSAAVASASASDARRAGRIYAALTLGNILGLGLAAAELLPRFGLDQGLLVVLAAAFLTPLPALLGATLRPLARVALAALLVAGAGVALFAMPPWSMRMLHTAPYVYSTTEPSQERGREVIAYHKSAFETSITVLKNKDDLFLQLDGKTTGSTTTFDQSTQSLLGALPAALHPGLKRALVIGLGTGQTPAAVLRFPIEHVDAAEICPEVAQTLDWFRNINDGCKDDPRFKLLVADGRTVLRYGEGSYDLVVSEPSNVWIPGVAHLFTHESFEDVRRRLDPERGIACQWMQGYGLELPVLQAVVRTFLDVFPNTTLWFSSLGWPDVFLVGSVAPIRIDVPALEQRLAKARIVDPDQSGPAIDALGLLRCFIAGPDALRRFAGPGPFTRDSRPMLEYAAEVSLMTGNAHPTRQMIMSLCESPAPLLVNAPPALLAALEKRVAANRDLNRIMVEGDAGNDGLTDEAFVRLRALVGVHPDDAGLRDSVAGVFAEAAKEKFYALDFLPPAERPAGLVAPHKLLTDAAALAPDHPSVLRCSALLAGVLESFDEAIALLDREAKVTEPWRLETRFEQARMMLKANRVHDAAAACRELLARDPLFPPALQILGQACAAVGDFAGARAAWKRQLELNPDAPVAVEGLRMLEGSAGAR
jgi:spermidine synthase